MSNSFVSRNLKYLFGFILISLIIFFPTLAGEPFWDDWVYLFRKSGPLMVAHSPLTFFPGGSSFKSWPVFYAVMWALLKIFKTNYLYYHLMSLSLHGVNGFLLWKILEKFNTRNSTLLAALYTVHPLHLFTIAWIMQFKTILSIFFLLIAVLILIEPKEEKKIVAIILALFFYLLSVLSKSATVSLAPCLLIMIILNKEKRISRWAIFLIIAIALIALFSTSLTFWNSGTPGYEFHFDNHSQRIITTAKNFFRYFFFIIYPYKNHIFFQKSTMVNYSSIEMSLLAIGSIFFSFLFSYLIKRKMLIEIFGLSFYSLSLIPLCGIFALPLFGISNFNPYWLSIPFLGLIPIIGRTIRFKLILLPLIAVLALNSHLQSYKVVPSEDIFTNSISDSPEVFSFKRPYIEHLVFINKCQKALLYYKINFIYTHQPNMILESKIRDCIEKSRPKP